MRRLNLTVLLIATALCCSAQFKRTNPEPPRQQQQSQEPALQQREPEPTFSTHVNLVRILASVRDSNGAFITTLDKSEFAAQDTGVEQKIAVFERNTSLPLSIAVLIDTSGSTRGSLPYETQSIRHFIGTLLNAGNPDDAFELLSFNWRTNLEVDFTRNARRAERALHALHGDGGTSLYDAMFLASDTLGDREGRHVMIIVTDGGDTTSYKKFADALSAAQKVDAIVYPVVVVPVEADAGRNLGGEHALATIAASTGGRAFSPQGAAQLDSAFADILTELRTQYLIGFYPRDVPQQPRSFHPVKLSVRNPALRVSARSGYYEP